MLEERSKAYHQPENDSVSPVPINRVHQISMPNSYAKQRSSLPNCSYSNTQHNPRNSSTSRSVHKSSSHQYSKDQGRPQYNCTHLTLFKCYYFEGDHHLKSCNKFSKDKAKYKLKSADMFQKCKDKIMQQAKKENVSINEAAFMMAQESTYSVEKAEQLLGNMHFRGSDSKLE